MSRFSSKLFLANFCLLLAPKTSGRLSAVATDVCRDITGRKVGEGKSGSIAMVYIIESCQALKS